MDTPGTSMPDITAMQKLVGSITVLITSALSTATALGHGLTIDQDTKLLALWAAVSGVALTADAIIRQGRAKHVAIVKAAEITAAAPAKAVPVFTLSSAPNAAVSFSGGTPRKTPKRSTAKRTTAKRSAAAASRTPKA